MTLFWTLQHFSSFCFILTQFIFIYFQACSFCNCSLYNKTDTTTVPTTDVTSPPYDVVNNPDGSTVNSPIDVSLPVAQTACGIQIYSGKIKFYQTIFLFRNNQ
jgi:hypothetical protein